MMYFFSDDQIGDDNNSNKTLEATSEENKEKKEAVEVEEEKKDEAIPLAQTIKEEIKEEIINFSKYPIKRKRISSSLLKFNMFYKIHKLSHKIILAVSIGLITAFLAVVMVENTGLYTGGTSAFFQGIARFVFVLLELNNKDGHALNTFIFNVLYWFLYLILNIVLAIFAWKKIGKEFTIISFMYILSTQLFGFTIGMIFNSNNIHFNIFGVTSTIDQQLSTIGAKCIYFNPTYFPTINSQTGNYDWTVLYTETDLIKNFPLVAQTIISSVRNENLIRTYALFIYAITYSIISASFYSVLYILGGSSAGSDFYTVYLNRSKGHSVGKLYTYINGIFMTSGVIIGSFLSATVVDYKHYFNLNTLLSANLVASALWVFFSGWLIDYFFPKEKSVEVVIYTDKIDQILNHLQKVNYPHAISNNIVYSLNNTTHNRLITTCFYFELPKLINAIRKYDDTCMIVSKIVRDIDGEVDVEEGVG